jgi:hypothetical protein
MPSNIVVNNVPIAYPSPGDAPGWGESATTFAEEVATVLSNLNNTNDILETSFSVANNISVSTNVTGLSFNTGAVRAAEVSYSIIRSSSTRTSGVVESGTMNVVYDSAASSGNKWQLAVGPIAGPGAGVTFTITDAGQVQYKSTDIGSTSYSGEMRFRAKTILST